MSILALILALVLDRLFPALRAYRTAKFPKNLWLWLERCWTSNKLPRGLVPLVLLFPAVLVLWLFYKVFTANLLVFGLDLLLAFYCLRPNVINEDVDSWIDDLQAGKVQSSDNSLRLFGLANKNLYTIIFWFVLLGPVFVVAYRLLDIMRIESTLSTRQYWSTRVDRVLGWIEWMPALLSGFIFMVAGNFDAGARSARSLAYTGVDIQNVNEERLQKIGIASIAGNEAYLDDIELVRRSRGLLLRTLVLWLVLACLIDFWL